MSLRSKLALLFTLSLAAFNGELAGGRRRIKTYAGIDLRSSNNYPGMIDEPGHQLFGQGLSQID